MDKMIAKGLTTFDEGDYDERSDCHAWGATPNYDLLATVCGITGFVSIPENRTDVFKWKGETVVLAGGNKDKVLGFVNFFE